MFHTLKRDCGAIRANQRLIAVMLFVWLLIFWPQGNLAFLAGMCGVLAGIILSSSIVDAYRGLNVPPGGPKGFVVEKYLFGVLLTLIMAAFTGFAGLLMTLFMDKIVVLDVAVAVVGCLICCLFYMALLLPFLFKLGIEKAKTITILCFAIPYGILLVLVVTGQIVLTTAAGFPSMLTFALIVSGGLYVISFLLAQLLVEKKS